MNIRRLAAVDMHGLHGAARRQWIILAEFVLGAVGGIAFGLTVLVVAPTIPLAVLGVYTIGVSVNYVPLALHAVALAQPGALEVELSGLDLHAELRHYTLTQFWIFVPTLFVVLAISDFFTRRTR